MKMFVGLMIAALVAPSIGAEPPTADAFSTDVKCDTLAATYTRETSRQINHILAEPGGAVSGRIVVDEGRPDGKWLSEISFVAQSPEKSVFTEMGFALCGDHKSVCIYSATRHGLDNRGSPAVSGQVQFHQIVPFSIRTVDGRTWLFTYETTNVTLHFDHEVAGLVIKCVAVKGSVVFDLNPLVG